MRPPLRAPRHWRPTRCGPSSPDSTRPADPRSSGNRAPSGTIHRRACGEGSDSTHRRCVPFADEELHALSGLVPELGQHVTGQLDEREALIGEPSERRQLRPEVEPSFVVAPQHPVRLERHRQAMRGRPRQPGRRLEGAERGRPLGNGAENVERLVEHADTRYSVHIARTLSQIMRSGKPYARRLVLRGHRR